MQPHPPKAGPAPGPAFGVSDPGPGGVARDVIPSSTTAAAQFGFPRLTKDVRVWLVRHGETEWSRNGRHTGTTDIPLTENGRVQAEALSGMLARVGAVRVLSSPRRRALDTARLAGLEVDEVSEDLAEWDYGEYEGITSEQIHERVPDWTVFTHGCPGGESVEQVQQRADRLLARLADWLERGPIVLFGHGHFSRVLGARWVGLPASGGASLSLGTAAPSVLGADYGAPAILRWNLPNPAD